MRKLVQVSKLVMVVGVLGIIGFGAASATARPPCLCPDVYAPVICSNGQVYSNYCQAGCQGARGCVPFGDDVAVAGN
jgi:hypothetical protein